MKKTNLIGRLALHPVAANIIMILMILVGLGSILRMNIQFLPNFTLNNIQVSIEWPGASAEDFTRVVTTPLEQKFKQIDGIKKVTSNNQRNVSQIMLEFDEDTSLILAQDKVKQLINETDVIPSEAKAPKVKILDHLELIAKVLVSNQGSIPALRRHVYQFEEELRQLGFAKVTVNGIPQQELEIAIPSQQLLFLGLSLPDLSQLIKHHNHYTSMGMIGQNTLSKTLQNQEDARSPEAFKQLIIHHHNRPIRLGDIGKISLKDKRYEPSITYNNQHAATIALYRAPSESALASADRLHLWLDKKQNQTSYLTIQPYFESWQLIKERINLLLSNGLWGLLFILVVLFLFLQARVAVWVAVGIPSSFLAGLGALYFAGGTINMVSLFAIIMTLGIIVDDTIVVGEEILSRLQKKVPLVTAISEGTREMLAPIMASSLTTIAAFLPLMMINGNMGQILFAIPLVVICVIIASLVECFFVLPGHLYHSFKGIKNPQINDHHAPLHHYFVRFRDGYFDRLSVWSLTHRSNLLAAAFGIFLVSVGLITSQRIPFTFFPSTDGTKIEAQVSFLAGTPVSTLEHYLPKLRQSLTNTNTLLNGQEPLTQLAISRLHQAGIHLVSQGAHQVSVVAELSQPDERSVTNQDFIDAWTKNIPPHPMIEKVSVQAPRGGPPGQDIDVAISGAKLVKIKQASKIISNILKQMPGVFNVQDDLPEGQETLTLKLKPQAYHYNLDQKQLSAQVAAAYQGQVIQRYFDQDREIDVLVRLPDQERFNQNSLQQIPIKVANNQLIPLGRLAETSFQQGYDIIKQQNGQASIHVTASVDTKKNNANQIISALQNKQASKIERDYQVKIAYEGKAKEQRETLTDIKFGLIIGLSLIYIILATVFSSYTWPLIIMSIIPVGLTGGILGHYLLNIDFTILSLFGFFGLAGIVINDSIILVNRYRILSKTIQSPVEAMREAMKQRLRPVILTSLTTIVGLLPIIFETSLQAQFLIPMAVTISFGLAYATCLVLLVVPAAMLSFELKYPRANALVQQQSLET